MRITENMTFCRALSMMALLIVSTGCGQEERAKPSDPNAKVTATSPDQVEVLYSQPTKPLKELGLVTAQTGRTVFHGRSADGMIERMREKAAEMGADAIIIRNATDGQWAGGNDGFQRGQADGIAIRWAEDAGDSG